MTLLFWLLPLSRMQTSSLSFQTHCAVKLDHTMWLQWDFLMYDSFWRGIMVVQLAKAISVFPWQPGFESSRERPLSRHPFIFNLFCFFLFLSLFSVNDQITTKNCYMKLFRNWTHIPVGVWHASVLQGKIPGLIILSCWHSGWALLLGHA